MSHAVYDTRYHLVRALKYRKWILKERVRDAVKELFEEILAALPSFSIARFFLTSDD